MGTYVKVAKTDEVGDNAGKLVEAEGKQIALLRSGGNYYALDNECTHVGGPLCEGTITAEDVICPWHGATFKLTSGELKSGPARSNVNCYPVRVQGDDIEVEV